MPSTLLNMASKSDLRIKVVLGTDWVGVSAVPRCYTCGVPTKHPRVSVTVTPALQEARERLRRRGVNASVAQLALAGASELLAAAEAHDTDEQRRAELRRRLTQRLRSRDTLDDAALREVRESGWTRA